MPHSLPLEFDLVRTYFLENKDLVINLINVKTIRVVGSSIWFLGERKVIGVVDFFSKELALTEFKDITTTLNHCVTWRKKND
jgi:hypothetical protein